MLYEKHPCSHYEKFTGSTVHPSHINYHLIKCSIHYTFFSSLHSSTNQELFEKQLCNQASMMNMDDFHDGKGAIMCN